MIRNLFCIAICAALACLLGSCDTVRNAKLVKANNAAMRVFVALLMVVVLASCSTQVARLPDGTTYVNNNLFAKGSLQQGDLRMSGNSEKAAEVAGQYGKALINAALIKTGIEAAESMTNNAVDAVK